MRKIMVVDDDPNIREIVRFALSKAGFEVVEAGDGVAGLKLLSSAAPDLIVLDIVMPELDGINFCKQVRQSSNVPIIFLTSVDDEVDRIVGLEIGGDDYVTKPFSPRELVARVKVVLRRAYDPPEERTNPELVHGALRLDCVTYKSYFAGNEIVLTVTEFRILETLLQFPGKVYSRDELLDNAYPDGTFVTDRTIDSHIKRIRKKFEKHDGNPIETVHGLGYRIGAC